MLNNRNVHDNTLKKYNTKSFDHSFIGMKNVILFYSFLFFQKGLYSINETSLANSYGVSQPLFHSLHLTLIPSIVQIEYNMYY